MAIPVVNTNEVATTTGITMTVVAEIVTKIRPDFSDDTTFYKTYVVMRTVLNKIHMAEYQVVARVRSSRLRSNAYPSLYFPLNIGAKFPKLVTKGRSKYSV